MGWDGMGWKSKFLSVDDIYANNDLQLFDLQEDPDEATNLALDRKKSGKRVLKMNKLLNELMAAEVGENNGAFLPEAVRPERLVVKKTDQ
jgi:hypothetical protein